ncbi:MAG: OmpP1/FadL family transporter, partial [Alphaproteobacteria bacterium]
GLGRAYAGVGVVGDDYSSIAFNPAGMGLKKSGMQMGMTAVNLRADVYRLDDGKNDKMNFWVPIPNAFAQYHIDDRWNVGFGIYAPFGLKTQYRSSWFAADSAVKSELQIVDFAPAVSYKLTDTITIGGSFIARYIYGHMTNNLPAVVGGGKSDFELDGWTRTGTLGIMYEPTQDTRLGFSWRFRSTQQVKGDHKITGNSLIFNQTATGWASPDLPETATLSFYQKVQKVGISATARWTHWSQSFPEFSMRSNSRLFNQIYASNPMGSDIYQKTSKYNYDNTWTLSLGADYYHNENWTFRAGVAYDEGATHNDLTRTYRIPDNDRFWTSLGFSYMNDNYQFDFGYSHIFVRASKVIANSQNGETVSGKYKRMHSDLIGIQIQYAF